jgi:NADH-quinone oxidoreductase subunit A
VIRAYLPAIVFVGLGAILGFIFATANSLLGPKPRYRRQSTQEPYESGLPSEVKKTMRFGISFYLVAMLFILFDIETIFLFPVAVQLKAFGRSRCGRSSCSSRCCSWRSCTCGAEEPSNGNNAPAPRQCAER